MPILKEDGSGSNPAANSYVTETELEAFAEARGVVITGDAEVLLIQAMDYLESFDSKFKGTRVSRDQPLSWPRSGAYIEGWNWSSTEIPRQVLSAQLALCMEIFAGEDPRNPSLAALPVISERVEGAVTVQYANPGTALKVHKAQASRTHINLLLKSGGLFAVRV